MRALMQGYAEFGDVLCELGSEMELGQVYRPKMTMDTPADEAKRRAEGLVSDWHRRFRLYIGGGAGLDHQARTSLVLEIAAAIAQPLAEVARLEDAAPARPARRAKED